MSIVQSWWRAPRFHSWCCEFTMVLRGQGRVPLRENALGPESMVYSELIPMRFPPVHVEWCHVQSFRRCHPSDCHSHVGS
jgi:hypothetical protein